MLEQELHHFKIVAQNCVVNRKHTFLVFCAFRVLLEVHVSQPILMLVKQILDDVELAMHGCDVDHVLPLRVGFIEFDPLAPHEHLHHDQAKLK